MVLRSATFSRKEIANEKKVVTELESGSNRPLNVFILK